jgi:Zn ribbon nucleic-acid-binding protein
MSVATLGIQGRCAHCQTTQQLKPWQLNAIAINEQFTCAHCQKSLELRCPKQIKRFRSLDSLGLLRFSTSLTVCTALLVALVMEWIGLLSVSEQLNASLIVLFVYFALLRFVHHRQHMTLILDAAKAHAD